MEIQVLNVAGNRAPRHPGITQVVIGTLVACHELYVDFCAKILEADASR